jgi:hypothetical protein
MRRLLEIKAVVVVLALAGLVGLGLLVAALREANFEPPGPFPFSFSSGQAGNSLSSPGRFQLPFLEVLALIASALVLLGLILALLNPKARKRVLLALLRFGLTMAMLWWLMENMVIRPPKDAGLPVGQAAGEGGLPGFTQPPPQFAPPQVNSWIIFLVSFVLALGMVALAWFVVSRRSKTRHTTSFDEVAGIARHALADLQDGHRWDDAIIAAYTQMNEVVTAERGLIRQPGVTPFEFAIRMEQMGLPGEAARALTRLFEQVRYGGQSSTRTERDLAVAALNAILRACGVSPSGISLSNNTANRGGL